MEAVTSVFGQFGFGFGFPAAEMCTSHVATLQRSPSSPLTYSKDAAKKLTEQLQKVQQQCTKAEQENKYLRQQVCSLSEEVDEGYKAYGALLRAQDAELKLAGARFDLAEKMWATDAAPRASVSTRNIPVAEDSSHVAESCSMDCRIAQDMYRRSVSSRLAYEEHVRSLQGALRQLMRVAGSDEEPAAKLTSMCALLQQHRNLLQPTIPLPARNKAASGGCSTGVPTPVAPAPATSAATTAGCDAAQMRSELAALQEAAKQQQAELSEALEQLKLHTASRNAQEGALQHRAAPLPPPPPPGPCTSGEQVQQQPPVPCSTPDLTCATAPSTTTSSTCGQQAHVAACTHTASCVQPQTTATETSKTHTPPPTHSTPGIPSPNSPATCTPSTQPDTLPSSSTFSTGAACVSPPQSSQQQVLAPKCGVAASGEVGLLASALSLLGLNVGFP